MNQCLPVFNIKDVFTRNVVGSIASRALHRVLAVGFAITPAKPLHLYKHDISVVFHCINQKPKQYRVVVSNVSTGETFISCDIEITSKATESILTLGTSVEELTYAQNSMHTVNSIEYIVGNITDTFIQQAADEEAEKAAN